ncbi:hypothetical protein [Pseudoduganella rhizocola]|uniref:hypothetical protein n=1 Tax=Pseudoduganella rhizocola TaxID=3382643 RepID=UPI0038B5520C
MKNFETVYDWLLQVVNGQRGVESVHLNRLDGDKCRQLAGLELVQYVREILLAVVLHLQTALAGHGVRQVVVFLPVDVTDELMFWTPEVWNGLNCADEPPSLYVICDQQVFDDDCEEYRRPVPMPVGGGHDVKAIFRSFRDQDAIDNSWEFTSGVYLIARLD